MESFKKDETRLDEFWVKLIDFHSADKYYNLLNLIKIVMIISHGNSELERGFSVNKECIVENQTEKSLIAQRLIYDSIKSTDKPLIEFEITKNLISNVRMSSTLYKENLAEERKKREKEEQKRKDKKIKETILQELEMKKKKIMDDAIKDSAAIEKEILDLKKR